MEEKDLIQASSLKTLKCRKLIRDYIKILNLTQRGKPFDENAARTPFYDIINAIEEKGSFFSKIPPIKDISIEFHPSPIEEYFKNIKNTIYIEKNKCFSDLNLGYSVSLKGSNTIYGAYIYCFLFKFMLRFNFYQENFMESNQSFLEKFKNLCGLFIDDDLYDTIIDTLLNILFDTTSIEEFKSVILNGENFVKLSAFLRICCGIQIYHQLVELKNNNDILGSQDLLLLFIAIIDENTTISLDLIKTFLDITSGFFDGILMTHLFINPKIKLPHGEPQVYQPLNSSNTLPESECIEMTLYYENNCDMKILLTYEEYCNFLQMNQLPGDKSSNASLLDFENLIRKKTTFPDLKYFVDGLDASVNWIKEFEVNIISMIKMMNSGDHLPVIEERIKEITENIDLSLFADKGTPESIEEIRSKFEAILETFHELVIRTREFQSNPDHIREDIPQPGIYYKYEPNMVYQDCCYKVISDGNQATLNLCKHSFCRSCLKKYIIKETFNNVFLTYLDLPNYRRVVKCMKKDCPSFITKQDMVALFDDNWVEIFNRYEQRFYRHIPEIEDKFISDVDNFNHYPCSICSRVELDDSKLLECRIELNNGNDDTIYDPHWICSSCCKKLDEVYKDCDYIKCPVPNCDREFEAEAVRSKIPEKIPIVKIEPEKSESTKKIERLYQKVMRLRKPKKLPGKAPDIVIPNATLEKTCMIEMCPEDNDTLVGPVCQLGHYLHKECIVQWFLAQEKDWINLRKTYEDLFVCFGSGAPHYMNQRMILNYLQETRPDVHKRMMTIVNEKKGFQCVKCGYSFLPLCKNSTVFRCENCNQFYCYLCKEIWHEDKKCPMDMDRQKLFELYKGDIRGCPYCYQPYLKDDKCMRVFCKNCQHEYSFCCGAKRAPILAHDNSYHRPSCKDRSKGFENQVKWEKKCLVCQAIKRKDGKEEPCPIPEELNEIGDIPQGEIDWNKIYQDYFDREVEKIDK